MKKMKGGMVLWSNKKRYYFPWTLPNELNFGSPLNTDELGKFIRSLIDADPNAVWKFFDEDGADWTGKKVDTWRPETQC